MRRPVLLGGSLVASEALRAYLIRRGLLVAARANPAQKAKTPGIAGPGSSVRNPIEKGSNHGIRKV